MELALELTEVAQELKRAREMAPQKKTRPVRLVRTFLLRMIRRSGT
ncbi:hypothetical protein [Thermosulfurimonas sp. F29]|nr:hypothetical protein [Thermosulfurimonas sp. F29]MBX6424173.1 hypothetical protein [Thermosulfurimonas sp. F29]